MGRTKFPPELLLEMCHAESQALLPSDDFRFGDWFLPLRNHLLGIWAIWIAGILESTCRPIATEQVCLRRRTVCSINQSARAADHCSSIADHHSDIINTHVP